MTVCKQADVVIFCRDDFFFIRQAHNAALIEVGFSAEKNGKIFCNRVKGTIERIRLDEP